MRREGRIERKEEKKWKDERKKVVEAVVVLAVVCCCIACTSHIYILSALTRTSLVFSYSTYSAYSLFFSFLAMMLPSLYSLSLLSPSPVVVVVVVVFVSSFSTPSLSAGWTIIPLSILDICHAMPCRANARLALRLSTWYISQWSQPCLKR